MINYITYGNNTGYGHSARNYLLALDSAGINVKLTLLNRSWEQRCTSQEQNIINSMLSREDDSSRIMLFHCIPEIQRRFLREKSGRKSIGFSIYETEEAPITWKRYLEGNDLIFCPSRFCQSLVSKFGLNSAHIPHCLDYSQWIPGKYPDKFTGLIVGQWKHRKGKKLIQEILPEFPDIYWRILCDKPEEVQALFSRYSNIEVIDNELSTSEIIEFYNSGNFLLFPSIGEGFGLPVLESLSLNRPCIYSHHTALSEFQAPNWHAVEYKREIIENIDNIPQFRNSYWFVPDSYSIRANIVYVKKNWDIIEKDFHSSMKSKYDYPVVARKIKAELNKVLDID